MADVKIQVFENPNRVIVELHGEIHEADWEGIYGEVLKNVIGNETLLRAVMIAWNGQEDPFTVSEETLEKESGGWWSY